MQLIVSVMKNKLFDSKSFGSINRNLASASIILVIIAWVLGRGISLYNPGIREGIIFLLAVAAIVALLAPNRFILRITFYVAILTFAFGWRTWRVTESLIVSPSEVIVWLLAASITIRHWVRRESMQWYFPMPLVGLSLLTLPAVLIALGQGIAWDGIAAEAKNVLLVIPTFYVIQSLIEDMAEWRRVLVLTELASLYLAIAGLLFYFVPASRDVVGNLLGITLSPTEYFARISYPGWGPLAAWIMAWAWAGALAQLRIESKDSMFHWVTLLVVGAGIYLAGERLPWTAMLLGILVYTILQPRRALVIVAILAGLLLAIGQSGSLNQLVSAYIPALYDSGAIVRYGRYQNALDLMIRNPLGNGMTISGWVHSDILQIGADMGILAFIFFLLALGQTAWRLYSLQTAQRNSEASRITKAMLTCFVILLTAFFGGGLIALPFFIAPAWFFWAMCERLVMLQPVDLQLKKAL